MFMTRRSVFPRVRLHRPGVDSLTLLCALLILSQVLVTAFGGVEDLLNRGLYEVFGLSRTGLQEGRLWQVATHAFLHGSWFHLLLNGMVIFMIGGRVYDILGGRAFLKIAGGGVILGSVLHLCLHPVRPTVASVADAPLIGASAAAMALLLTVTSLSPDSRRWPLMVSGKNLGRGLLAATVLLYLITPGLGIPGLSLIGAWLERQAGMETLFQVGHIYHFGGGLVGWLYARRLLRKPITLEELQRARAKRERSMVV
jgi:membrane associated rhomboid family serine protease